MKTIQKVLNVAEQEIFRVHKVKVHSLQLSAVMKILTHWLDGSRKGMRYIVSTNINNIVCALESTQYYEVIENADLSLPDGVPLLWVGRYKGFTLPKRCGIEEVMLATFELSNQKNGYSHYFYGNTEQVLIDLKNYLNKNFPQLCIVGMHSPPFRALSEKERSEHLKMINDSAPDFLWVSLGCPLQETWLWENRCELFNVGIGGGAGAVFNLLAGHSIRTPECLRMMGLEWVIRLISEPKRLWRRYLLRYPKFILAYLRLLNTA